MHRQSVPRRGVYPRIRRALLVASLWVTFASLGGVQAREFREPDEGILDRHGHYVSRADGQSVHQPAKTRDGSMPPGASAQCRDGNWSFSHTHRGTCSRHGGVANWEP